MTLDDVLSELKADGLDRLQEEATAVFGIARQRYIAEYRLPNDDRADIYATAMVYAMVKDRLAPEERGSRND